MSDKLTLPDSSPKGVEHEKWKAMVDSVVEFISASRAMLNVLNERIKENERLRNGNAKTIEEQKKTKLKFYKEFLASKIKTEETLDTVRSLNVSEPCLDNGDQINKKEKQSVSVSGELNDKTLLKQERKFVSRIPKTRSCVDRRTTSCGIERTQNEGTYMNKYHRSRKPSEVGYSVIHQRNRTPGDGTFRF